MTENQINIDVSLQSGINIDVDLNPPCSGSTPPAETFYQITDEGDIESFD